MFKNCEKEMVAILRDFFCTLIFNILSMLALQSDIVKTFVKVLLFCLWCSFEIALFFVLFYSFYLE